VNVGLTWMGSKSHRNDGNRSLPRGALAPLAHVEGVQWHCLCREGWDDRLAELGMVNGLEGCADWYDTAQAIQRLDLVISVDTAIAHLSGGFGIPTWMLIAAVPDMRWMLDRDTTPWYRSVRLYRQQRAGEWGPVMARVANDLQQEVWARRAAAA
jgi:hypothetical protein